MMATTLAIDQSTSATKAIVFRIHDGNAEVLSRSSAAHDQLYPAPGRVEHDAGHVWQNTLSVARAAIAQANVRIDQISLTNQRETFVLFDAITGKPVCPAIVWQCRSGVAVCDRLRAAGFESTVRSRTGLTIDTYFSGPKLAHLLEHDAALRQRVGSGNVRFGTIDTYLIHRMTNGSIYATDATNASRTLLMNITTGQWDTQLCNLFGTTIEHLPEIRNSSDSFGVTTLDGLLPPTPIRGVMGDSQAAALALGCVAPGDAKVTLGTGSSILVHTGTDFRDGGRGVMSTIALRHDNVSTYCFEGVINYSAATIEWLKNQMRLIDDPAETEAAARRTTDNAGVYLVPAFAGLSAPHWLPTARAAIVGLTGGATRDHILRAALESIAYQIADALESMSTTESMPIKRLHVDGGASKNKWLCQFIADIVGTELTVSRLPDCSALGAAIAGMLPKTLTLTVGDIYTPAMSSADRTRLRAGWMRAVRQVAAGV